MVEGDGWWGEAGGGVGAKRHGDEGRAERVQDVHGADGVEGLERDEEDAEGDLAGLRGGGGVCHGFERVFVGW